jgi:hypothetical protein
MRYYDIIYKNKIKIALEYNNNRITMELKLIINLNIEPHIIYIVCFI